MKLTLSVIKADIGGYVGHSASHPDILAKADECLAKAKEEGLLIDYHVTECGDDLQLIMTHQQGEENEKIHKLAWDTFIAGTEVAKKLKLYGAGQDLLSDAFSGNVKGMGPGVAEMEIEERKSEPVIIFMADKTSSGAWNMPLYKMFADPFNTIGLVIATNMHEGFAFEVHDVKEHKKITLNTPEELYDLKADPDQLRNLVDNPALKDVLDDMRRQLLGMMESTDDPLRERFAALIQPTVK